MSYFFYKAYPITNSLKYINGSNNSSFIKTKS